MAPSSISSPLHFAMSSIVASSAPEIMGAGAPTSADVFEDGAALSPPCATDTTSNVDADVENDWIDALLTTVASAVKDAVLFREQEDEDETTTPPAAHARERGAMHTRVTRRTSASTYASVGLSVPLAKKWQHFTSILVEESHLPLPSSSSSPLPRQSTHQPAVAV